MGLSVTCDKSEVLEILSGLLEFGEKSGTETYLKSHQNHIGYDCIRNNHRILVYITATSAFSCLQTDLVGLGRLVLPGGSAYMNVHTGPRSSRL